MGHAARLLGAVPLCAWPVMAVIFPMPIVTIRSPPVHKRFRMLLMIGMMTPAIARVFLTLIAPPGAGADGPPPPFVSIPPALVADLFLIVAMVHDWRARGRPHPVYGYGGLVLAALQLLAVPVAAPGSWMSFAKG